MHRSLPLHGRLSETEGGAPRPALAVSGKGFRLFFLLAAAFAMAMVPTWLLVLGGSIHVGGMSRASYLAPTYWHAHEMVFGFTVAVIAGFLLTAVANWTQRETLVGPPLLALGGLWLVGRVAMTFTMLFSPMVTACLDLAFLPVLIVVLARPLIAAKNRRNFVMLAVLTILFVANLMIHLDALGVAPRVATGWQRRGALLAIDVVVVLMVVIGGRVIPMFTRSATGVQSIQSIRILDVLAIGGVVGLTALDGFAPDSTGVFAGALAGIAGAMVAARTVRWGTRHAFKEPLVGILHVGHAWIVIGLLLRAMSAMNIAAIPPSAATHALTVGAIGSLTLGMMARVSLGHTGRLLTASRWVTLSFALIIVAALVRVLAVLLLGPEKYLGSIIVAGCLWTGAFALFIAMYARVLTTPRVDGKAG